MKETIHGSLVHLKNLKDGVSCIMLYSGLYLLFHQAKAAIQGGRKGNARERSALSKVNREAQESRRVEQSPAGSDSR